MSKQSEAKERQGYQAKPVPATCVNCAYYASEFKQVKTRWGMPYTKETNLRCGLGGFAIKKTATCNSFTRISPAQEAGTK